MFSNNESFPSVLSFHYSRSCPSAGKASQQMMRGKKKKKWHHREQRKRRWPFLDKGRLAPSACIPRGGGPWWQRHWWSIASHEKAINLIKKEVLTWEQGQKDQACDKSKNKGQCQCFQLWAFLENLWKPGGQIIEVCPIRPWRFNFIYRASFHEKKVNYLATLIFPTSTTQNLRKSNWQQDLHCCSILPYSFTLFSHWYLHLSCLNNASTWCTTVLHHDPKES